MIDRRKIAESRTVRPEMAVYTVTPGGPGDIAPERGATLANEQALLRGIRDEGAWATLTDHQRRVLAQYVALGGNLLRTAEALGVSRTAVRNSLRLAGKKFLAFGLVAED